MRLVLYVAMMVLTIADAAAQQHVKARIPAGYIGPVAGIGHSWVHNLHLPGSYNTQKSVGINYVGLLTRHWGIGSQLTLSAQGYQVNYQNAMQSFTPVYLRLPMRLYYFFGKPGNVVRPDVFFGSSVGFKVAESSHTTAAYRETYKINTSSFHAFDAGIAGGAGLNVKLAPNTWLNMDMGFYSGVTDAVEDMGDVYNPQSDVELNVGLLFGLR